MTYEEFSKNYFSACEVIAHEKGMELRSVHTLHSDYLGMHLIVDGMKASPVMYITPNIERTPDEAIQMLMNYDVPDWVTNFVADLKSAIPDNAQPVVYPLDRVLNCDYKDIAILKQFGDLVVVWKVFLNTERDNDIASSLLTLPILEHADCTVNALPSINTQTFQILSMESVLREMTDSDVNFAEALQMVVLTNEKKMFGAVAMFSDDLLQEVAHRFGVKHLNIIPSSVHEVIALPGDGTTESDLAYKMMIYEVNSTNVEPHEVLSDHVYHYNAESHTLWYDSTFLDLRTV